MQEPGPPGLFGALIRFAKQPREGADAAQEPLVSLAAHNVPVICNEFGAYDKASQLADRVRYYTDVVDIFEELAIPWQHWFMPICCRLYSAWARASLWLARRANVRASMKVHS